MLSCCTLEDWKITKDLHPRSSKTQNHISCASLSIPPDDFDVVDNPNTRKNLYITFENKALFETMKCEKNRWDSFDKKWPLPFVDVGQLVQSGFFYLQSDDKVQCAFCKLILCSWKAGDKPMKEHIKLSPKCPFLLNAGSTSTFKPQQYFPYSTECASTHFYPSKPKNPRMIDLKMRLSTFKNWPHTTIRVQDLAECGLYYTGVNDAVTCFYCGGSLSNWEPSDEPIVEHAKFYPKCNYLQIIQSRPVYKRLKSIGSNIPTSGNLPSNQLPAKDVLKSDIVQRAKEIFPSSMVDEVVLQQLQKGEVFSSLHHLCEKLLQQVDTNARSNPSRQKMENSTVIYGAASISTTSLESAGSANDVLLCKICMDREREVVFQPCGHLISCEKCATQITKCPLCRKHIDSTMRTFLS